MQKHQSVTNDHSVKKPLVAKIPFIYFYVGYIDNVMFVC
jgi:hypothetical protein